MIDFSKIEFSEREDAVHPSTVISGGIVLREQVRVSNAASKEARECIKEEMRHALHHKVYGDLRRPIMELLDIVSRSYDFDITQHIRKVQEEILELLAAPK